MTRDAPFEHTRGLMAKGWKRRRARQLRRQRYCQWPGCKLPATEVDHVIPRFEGGLDVETNLTSLCHRHHAEKTAAEGRRAWAAKKAVYQDRYDYTEPHPGSITT